MHSANNITPVIAFENVSVTYTGEPVIDHISFTLERGDYVGILGPNGSGKTTLLKTMLGLITPTSGVVRMFGKPISELDAHERSKIGFVPQRISEGRVEFPATVEEIVLSGRAAILGWMGAYRKGDRIQAEEAMIAADVLPLRDRLITTLSGGQIQRVLIARSLVSNPEVLILDEPTVGVDVGSQEGFYGFIKQLNNERNLTIVFVSHDIDVIAHEAKTILCLNRTLVCHGPSREVLTGDVLERVYGKKLRSIVHGH